MSILSCDDQGHFDFEIMRVGDGWRVIDALGDVVANCDSCEAARAEIRDRRAKK